MMPTGGSLPGAVLHSVPPHPTPPLLALPSTAAAGHAAGRVDDGGRLQLPRPGAGAQRQLRLRPGLPVQHVMERSSSSACSVLITHHGQGYWPFSRGFQLGMRRRAVATTDVGGSRLAFAVPSAVGMPCYATISYTSPNCMHPMLSAVMATSLPRRSWWRQQLIAGGSRSRHVAGHVSCRAPQQPLSGTTQTCVCLGSVLRRVLAISFEAASAAWRGYQQRFPAAQRTACKSERRQRAAAMKLHRSR